MIDISVPQLLWWVFASLALGGGLGTVSSRSPVSSLLFLVLALFSLAALYVLLGAHFVAAIQIIVYAGAIMVLFLFVIMLLNLGHSYRSDLRGVGWSVVAFTTAGALGYALSSTFAAEGATLAEDGQLAIESSVRELNAVGAIAQPMFRDFIVPFELTSILLLVAIVGAILLAKQRV